MPSKVTVWSLTRVQGVVTLFQHPDQLAELKADPAKWAAPFVEELCRYHTASAMAMKRTAKENVEIGGKVMGSYQTGCIIVDVFGTLTGHQAGRGHHRLEPVSQPRRRNLCEPRQI